MIQPAEVLIEPQKFEFKLLPGYAGFLFENRIDAYVDRMIEYSKAEQLPLLAKLDKFTYDELHAVGKISHGEVLEALANGTVAEQIAQNLSNWMTNNLEVIDKDEVVAEDVTLFAYIKRRCLQSFIAEYTDDPTTHAALVAEIDHYTTHEELICYNTYLRMQQEQLNRVNTELKFQEALLLEAQQLSDLGSYYMDFRNPENTFSTPQIEKITGMRGPDDAEFFDSVHPDDREAIKREWKNALVSGGAFDYTFRFSKNGSVKRLHSRGFVTFDDAGIKYVRGTLRDITQISELVERLTESEFQNKEAQRLTHLGNWSWDIEANHIQWSDEMYRIYGLEPQSETITFERFLGLVHPDSREARLAEINESIATGVAKDYTLKIVTPAGEIKILRGFGSIRKDAEGKPVQLMGTCQDITQEFQMKETLIRLNEKLLEKNEELLRTNSELESFNYIASHDLQEPLRKIQMYCGKIIHETGESRPEWFDTFAKISDAATRMRTLINDLMAFSQISLEPMAFESVELGMLFEEAKDIFSEAVENGVALFDIDPLPKATVIPFQFRQLITNIFGNAIKYAKPGRLVNVKVTTAIVPAKDLDFPGAKGKYLKISIADDGIGFNPTQRDSIFDLFRRLHTREAYSGTGVGLAICKKIMQNHGGYITADGALGVGAVFSIYLPQR